MNQACPPARIRGFFATKAPICVIVRRGPSKYSQMILWHTDTDVFEPGQWVKGHVHGFTMTSDARYAAIELMGARPTVRDSWVGTQIALICRPPYFTALEARIGGLCYTCARINPDDSFYIGGGGEGELIVNATNTSPLWRTGAYLMDDSGKLISNRYGRYEPRNRLDANSGPARGQDQRGREVLMEAGCIYDLSAGEKRLLFDCNELKFEAIEAPEWAKNW